MFVLSQESNFKLTQGIEEAIGKIETKKRQIEELELKMEADSRVMTEQVPCPFLNVVPFSVADPVDFSGSNLTDRIRILSKSLGPDPDPS